MIFAIHSGLLVLTKLPLDCGESGHSQLGMLPDLTHWFLCHFKIIEHCFMFAILIHK